MALAVLQNEGILLGGSCWVDPLGSLVPLKDRLDMEDGVLVGSCLQVQGDVESFPEAEEVPRIRRAGTFRPARVDPEGRIPQGLGDRLVDLQGDLGSQDEIHAAGMGLEVLRTEINEIKVKLRQKMNMLFCICHLCLTYLSWRMLWTLVWISRVPWTIRWITLRPWRSRWSVVALWGRS